MYICRNIYNAHSLKIKWDNYAPMQMISEYFPARGRPLNRVKNRVLSWNSNMPETSGRSEVRTSSKTEWSRNHIDPANVWDNPSCKAVRGWFYFNGQTITVAQRYWASYSILLIVDDDRGKYDKNRGSYKNGERLVRLSLGITVIVLLFWSSISESVMAFNTIWNNIEMFWL